jgi:Pyruvate/2-oxoacid:ferredoxin oxidoreductase delta subunit
MVLAELVCSDDACDLTVEVVAEEHELDVLVCDGCGCCLQVVSLSEVELVAAMPPPTPLRVAQQADLRNAA